MVLDDMGIGDNQAVRRPQDARANTAPAVAELHQAAAYTHHDGRHLDIQLLQHGCHGDLR